MALTHNQQNFSAQGEKRVSREVKGGNFIYILWKMHNAAAVSNDPQWEHLLHFHYIIFGFIGNIIKLNIKHPRFSSVNICLLQLLLVVEIPIQTVIHIK